MTLEVKKQNRETTQGLIRRFTKGLQQSGILRRAKSLRFRKKDKSKNMRKKAALRREEKRKNYDRQKKLGKLE